MDSIPVNSSLETADENGGVVEKHPCFWPLSTNRTSESPIKENLAPAATPTTVDNGLTQMKSRWSFSSSKRSFGGNSKDETFLDSHQWLQSDSEDDFYSVNGDFTPSLGSTPKRSFSKKLPHSLAPRSKKLVELFRDGTREEREENLEESSENQSEKTKTSSSDNSGGELKIIEAYVKETVDIKSLNHHHHHHCLPRFLSLKGRLIMEKRKKKKKKNHVK